MATNIKNIRRADITNQKPGYLQKAYIGILSQFTTVAQPGTTAGPLMLTIATDHEFTTPNGFLELYSLPNKNEGTMETNGDRGALNTIYSQKFFVPGDSPTMEQTLLTLLNDDVICLVVDPLAGKVRQIGDDKIPANFVKQSFQSGTTHDGMKGYTFEIDSTKRFWYEGEITVGSWT